MYTAIEGVYEDGVLTLAETPPTTKKSKVVVMFMDVINQRESNPKRIPGSLKRLGEQEGKTYRLSDNFNEPLDDLNEYM